MSNPSNINPAASGTAITPDNDTNIPPTRGVYVGVSGDLAVHMIDGSELTFVGLAAGSSALKSSISISL